jgi:integrase
MFQEDLMADIKIESGLYTRINRYGNLEYIAKFRPPGSTPKERNLTKKDKADNKSKAREAFRRWRDSFDIYASAHSSIDSKDAKSMQLDDLFFNHFLTEQKSTMQKEYSKIYRSHLQDKFGKRIMQSITKEEMREHISDIIKRGRQIRLKEPGSRRKFLKKEVPEYLYESKDRDGNIVKKVRTWDYVYERKAYSDRTIIYIAQVVGIIWDFAIEHKITTHDIGHKLLRLKNEKGDDIKLKAKKRDITYIINIDLLQAIRLIYQTTLKLETDLKFQTMILFGIFAIRREDEILNLRWSDIDLTYNRVIPQPKTVKLGYNAKYYIPATLQQALKRLREKYPEDTYLFQSEYQKEHIKPYHATALIDHFNRVIFSIKEELRLKKDKLNFHDLRHFFASIMAGYTSDRIIDRILEHHSNKIIDNYSNFEIKKIQTVLDTYEQCVLGDDDCLSKKSDTASEKSLVLKEKELELKRLELLIEAKKLGIEI